LHFIESQRQLRFWC